jgi:fucose 4-O-acetylase-like acetyltransferase
MTSTSAQATSTVAQSRLAWIDYAKGIGIALVVWGHVIRGLFNANILPEMGFLSALDQGIYSFHMPLFFILSGLFVERSLRKSKQQFFIDKLQAIVYPYFLWSVLQSLLQIAAGSNTNASGIGLSTLLQLPIQPIMQFWFLYVLFLYFIIYAGLRSLKLSPMAIAGLSILFYYLQSLNLGDWGVLYQVRFYGLYFALGALVGQQGWLNQLSALPSWALGAIVLGSLGTIAQGISSGMSANLGWAPLYALAGSLSTFSLAILLEKLTLSLKSPHPSGIASLTRIASAIASYIAQWGRLSLEIYVAHTIASALCRMVLQKLFHINDPSIHILLGLGIGLYGPIALHSLSRRQHWPYLFSLKTRSA